MNQDREENFRNSDNVSRTVQVPATSARDASLQAVTREIWELAKNHQHDTMFLLSLLRSLEAIHREIRTEMFEISLPTTRNNLYQLVKDIEETGGWPYIERMKLRELLKNMELTRSDQQPETTDPED